VTRSFLVNGKRVNVDAPPLKSLLRVLREDCGLADVRQGCERGSCGACLVFVNGDLASSCLVPFHTLAEARVDTPDGLRGRRDFQELERALEEGRAFQCGFCSNGVLLAAYSLLRGGRSPTEEAVRDALSGNLCRCGSYAGIVDTVVKLGASRRGRRRG
jgi:aerobic-type carbon monoxide dehydrogenase small subunit (CoxS/CutS family)